MSGTWSFLLVSLVLVANPDVQSPIVLCEGPVTATITQQSIDPTKEAVIKEVTVLLLRSDQIIYREIGKTPLFKLNNRNGTITKVVLKDKSSTTWLYNAKTELLVGKVIAPEPVNLQPYPDKERVNQSRFLLMILDRLYSDLENKNRELEYLHHRTGFLGSAQELDELLSRAKYWQAVANKGEATIDSMRCYHEFVSRIQEQITMRKEWASRYLAAKRDFAKVQRNLSAVKNMLAVQGTVDGFRLLVTEDYGALQDIGELVREGIIVEQEAQDAKVEIIEGLSSWTNKAIADHFVAVKQSQQKYWQVDRQYEMPTAEVRQQHQQQMDAMYAKRNWPGISGNIQNIIAAGPQQFNPYVRWEMISAQVRALGNTGDVQKTVDRLLELAHETELLVRYIPPGAEYDIERVRFLILASRLAHAAINIEFAGKSMMHYSHPIAFYMQRLTDAALSYRQIVDINGVLRELRSRALLTQGNADDALTTALEVQELRRSMPGFAAHMAVLHCRRSKPNYPEALKWIEVAVTEAGESPQELQTDIDLSGLKARYYLAKFTAALRSAYTADIPGGSGTGFRYRPSTQVLFTNQCNTKMSQLIIGVYYRDSRGQLVYISHTNVAELSSKKSVTWNLPELAQTFQQRNPTVRLVVRAKWVSVK